MEIDINMSKKKRKLLGSYGSGMSHKRASHIHVNKTISTKKIPFGLGNIIPSVLK